MTKDYKADFTGQGPCLETIPEGDNRERMVCPDCGYIAYDNPKIVVGAVCTWEDKFLLCRRAIAPSIGLWTMPAGFMELGESMAEGAAREVREEACAEVEVSGLLGVYEIAHISQVYMVYRAKLLNPTFAAGDESLDVGLFTKEDIPWNQLAFPSVKWSLELFDDASKIHYGGAVPGDWVDTSGSGTS